ncbi:MAG: ASCH domain-containing protein [Bacteroidales bacterium]|nr:ASCH domain-containing protein [Bacteroidales bacterium]
MKKKILISINPEHVKNIINGTKKYEYRKIAAKQDISSIIIYETTPVKRIVAEAEIIDVLMLSPEELWKKTDKDSGISKQFYDEYFQNREVAYAYKLGKVKVYDVPKTLFDYGIKAAPQSFVYVQA